MRALIFCFILISQWPFESARAENKGIGLVLKHIAENLRRAQDRGSFLTCGSSFVEKDAELAVHWNSFGQLRIYENRGQGGAECQGHLAKFLEELPPCAQKKIDLLRRHSSQQSPNVNPTSFVIQIQDQRPKGWLKRLGRAARFASEDPNLECPFSAKLYRYVSDDKAVLVARDADLTTEAGAVCVTCW